MKSTEACREAARKIFLFDRLSGIAFLMAFGIAYIKTGTLAVVGIPPESALLLFFAAMVRASQFPFLWIEDAMEAPTPVSALLHSATMVAAGPFLLHKFSSYFAFLSTSITAWATLTMIVSGLLALSQENIKRVLAYSTIFNLSFMFMIFSSDKFPLVFATHALLKAGLFILVGTFAKGFSYSVSLGLEKKSWTSYLTLFMIFSLAGVPPLGLFWSKAGGGMLALLSVFISLIYLLRMYSKAFSGGIMPRTGIGTVIAGVLAFISVSSSVETSLPDVWVIVEFTLVAFIASRIHGMRLWESLGKTAERIFKFRMPQLSEAPDFIEIWGYRIGRGIMCFSDKTRSLLEGPVTRDVGYIAVSLAALALGVLLC